MPVITSAKKKMRQDKKRTRDNFRVKEEYRQAVRVAKEKPTKKSVSHAQSVIDKAAKRNIIHKNKAARLKRQITRHA